LRLLFGDDGLVPHLLKMMSLDSIDVVLTFLPTINNAGKSRVVVNDEARVLIQAVIVDGFSEQTFCVVRES
jgi:1-acyl-sn-glycerol-3-phosphate acyltransferase